MKSLISEQKQTTVNDTIVRDGLSINVTIKGNVVALTDTPQLEFFDEIVVGTEVSGKIKDYDSFSNYEITIGPNRAIITKELFKVEIPNIAGIHQLVIVVDGKSYQQEITATLAPLNFLFEQISTTHSNLIATDVSMLVYGEYVYLVGGSDRRNNLVYNKFYRIHKVTGAVEELPDCPTPVGKCIFYQYDNKLFVKNGFSYASSAGIYFRNAARANCYFDLNTNRWVNNSTVGDQHYNIDYTVVGSLLYVYGERSRSDRDIIGTVKVYSIEDGSFIKSIDSIRDNSDTDENGKIEIVNNVLIILSSRSRYTFIDDTQNRYWNFVGSTNIRSSFNYAGFVYYNLTNLLYSFDFNTDQVNVPLNLTRTTVLTGEPTGHTAVAIEKSDDESGVFYILNNARQLWKLS
jgi:hypothetical protein